MQAYHYWLIVGIILLILEIFTSGFLLASFGFAALAAAMSAYFGAALTTQILIFAVAALVFFFAVRPLFLGFLKKFGQERRTGVEALIGQTGVVVEAIDNDQGKGRVKIGGEDWRARLVDGGQLESGARVVVSGVEGATVFVQQASEGE